MTGQSVRKIIRVGKNKVPYIEISSEIFKNRHRLINPISPEDFNEKFSQLMLERLGLKIKEFPEKFRFRFFYLEEGPTERKGRLEKISVHGSDRTTPRLKPIMPGYVGASSTSGIEQKYLFDCGSLPHFSQNYRGKHNALLIYNSDKIYQPAGGVEYTFKNMSNRGSALFAIVALV